MSARPFTDTSYAVHYMCVAGERGETLGPFSAEGLFAFSRSWLDPLGVEIDTWEIELPAVWPTIEHRRYCWHYSLCHLGWPA